MQLARKFRMAGAVVLGMVLVALIPCLVLGATTWDWDFGDGMPHGTTQNPTHTYGAPGTYTWTMTLTMGGQPCVQSGQVVVSDTCSISKITSKTSKPGSAATITGNGFSKTAKKDIVYFGTLKASVSKATTTKLRVTIPKKCKKGRVNVYVSVGGQKSNTKTFVVK